MPGGGVLNTAQPAAKSEAGMASAPPDAHALYIESTHTIEITDFVDLAAVNPKFFYKPYFLEAQKGGDKGYSLLHRARSASRRWRSRTANTWQR
jgi:hypothetical protein